MNDCFGCFGCTSGKLENVQLGACLNGPLAKYVRAYVYLVLRDNNMQQHMCCFPISAGGCRGHFVMAPAGFELSSLFN